MSISPFLRPSDLSLERSYLATPLSPEILSVRDARSFENEFFRIRLSNDSLILHSTGNRSGFSEMNSLRQESRRQSNDPTQRKAELFSAEGSLVHNIGISAEIIVNFGGKKYLLSIHQDRQHTVGDEVVKLISGFTDWRGFPQTGQTSGGEPFFSSLLSELREEILPLCPDCALP
ncbi:MAG: hypothetical protein KDD64_17200, partial [Bdellovibrionales bacterium]|nr:hypothetical protein [Bdellovibrionales bacterium]